MIHCPTFLWGKLLIDAGKTKVLSSVCFEPFEVSDCVMKARLTGVQSKDAHYSQYTLQSSFTLYVHFPPDVGNIDGPIDLKVVEIAPAFQLDPHLRDRLHADAVNLARQVRLLYPYGPPPVAVVS